MSQVHLVGIDCSECSERALEYAAEKASTSDSRLIIAHVIEWSPYSFNTAEENAERHKRREAELERAESEIVGPLVQKLQDRGINAGSTIRHGHAARTLKALADEHNASSIIIGRHGASGFHSQLFGSVAGTLIQISDQPVTVVP